MNRHLSALLLALVAVSAGATEYHVAPSGDDQADGSVASPLRTISAAAALAQPGDTVTVHEGVYRERVNPPRGGTSDSNRITYQAAPGEKAAIKGSEVAKGWVLDRDDVWKLTLPNGYFGEFNPYSDEIRGDWFDPRGRVHHTGAVYLDGHWLTEAAALDHLYNPEEAKALYAPGASEFLLNVAWIRPAGADDAALLRASGFSEQQGLQTAECSEGGDCIGFINHGDWAVYRDFAMPQGTQALEVRAASATAGGVIEARRDSPDGPLLGSCVIPNTGGWQAWQSFDLPIDAAQASSGLCLTFRTGVPARRTELQLWYGEAGENETTIWAQFPGVDPNLAEVEINVRQAVFYPEANGVNYLTVRGFSLLHAATNWAPPTAEQVGLIGVNWSKGWIIEGNTIAYSVCVGVTLGKHGDAFDNTSANSAEGYVETIKRAHAFSIPWSKDAVGGHIVRDNRISHCEQAGIVGSLGAAFSTVTRNVIHDIHVRRHFSGAEMAGIKIHAAIDTEISRNHVFRCCQALWLDWMAQGTRVTGNLFYDNEDRDLFMEVNHGPYVVDNNLLLSRNSLLDVSEGGAFIHNLFAGTIVQAPELNRETPYHPAHSTEVAGLSDTEGGDNRFYNNIFFGGTGLTPYDKAARRQYTAGNVYVGEAQPSASERDAVVLPEPAKPLEILVHGDGLTLKLPVDAGVLLAATQTTGSEALGTAAVSGQPYVNVDGLPIRFDTDYRGRPRNDVRPAPGPFEMQGAGLFTLALR